LSRKTQELWDFDPNFQNAAVNLPRSNLFVALNKIMLAVASEATHIGLVNGAHHPERQTQANQAPVV
jgi:hypothetical protein